MGDYETAGKFYWPSDHYSIPADNLCWHTPPSPNADFRCVRPAGHPGKHEHHWSPTVKDHSHKTPRCKDRGGLVGAMGECLLCNSEAGEACQRPQP